MQVMQRNRIMTLRPAWPGLSCCRQHELLRAPLVDDLRRVQIPVRVDRHVVHDIELARVRDRHRLAGASDVAARARALADVCLALLNSNEDAYVY